MLKNGENMADILDTNVLLRFLVGDNKKQQQQAKKWFSQAEKGKREIIVKPLVVAEACFVLESFYHQERDKIANAFEIFLSQRWLKVDERETLLNLWSLYRQNLHFVDSFLLAWIKVNRGGILTFDQQMLKRTKDIVNLGD